MQNYAIRWALFWPENHKVGLWSDPGNSDLYKASSYNKSGLIRAEVHAKEIGGTGMTHRKVICLGKEFDKFKWIAQNKVFSGGAGQIVGMSLVKKDGTRTEFYIDGTLIER